MLTIFDELEDIATLGLSIFDMSHNRVKNNSCDNKPCRGDINVGGEKRCYYQPNRSTD